MRRLVIAAWLALGILGLLEGAARLPALRSRLPPPVTGGAFDGIDAAWASLERQGAADCIVLGGATLGWSLRPRLLESAFLRSGQSPRSCAAVVQTGLSAATAAPLASILAQQYRPRWLIFGTDIPLYAEGGGAVEESAFVGSPWVRYRLGHRDLDGWLLNHSLSFRHFVRVREMAMGKGNDRLQGQREQGREAGLARRDDPHLRAWLEQAVAARWQMAGLDRLLDLASEGLRVVVVEMPLSPELLDLVPGWFTRLYEPSLAEIAARSAARGVAFLPTTLCGVVPRQNWLALNRPDEAGARAFSDWLGERMAELEKGATPVPCPAPAFPPPTKMED